MSTRAINGAVAPGSGISVDLRDTDVRARPGGCPGLIGAAPWSSAAARRR